LPRPPTSSLFPYTTLFRSKAALNRSLSHDDVLELLGRLFHYGRLSLSKFDPAAGIVHFGFHSGRPVLPEEKASLSVYLNELIPRSEEHTSELQSRSDLVCR